MADDRHGARAGERPLNDSSTAVGLVLLGVLLAGCRSPVMPAPESEPALAPRPAAPRPQVYDRTIVETVTQLPDGAGVLLLGRRRASPTSWISEAWIAVVDVEGKLRWEVGVDIPQAWAESAVVDPFGGIHVVGRSVDAGAWLLSLDVHGQQRALRELPNGERLGFAVIGAHVHVLLADDDLRGLSGRIWIRLLPEDPTQVEELRWIEGDADVPYGLRGAEPPPSELPESLDSAEPESRQLELGEPSWLELGTSKLLVVQLPPQAGHDARVVLARYAEADAAAGMAELRHMAAVPTELPAVDRTDADELAASWVWLMPVVESWADADVQRMVDLGDWLLERSCTPESDYAGYNFNPCIERHSFGGPSFFAPGDGCWRLAQVEDYLDVVQPEAFVANLEQWFELIETEHSYNDSNRALTDGIPVDSIIDTAFAAGQGETLMRAIMLDFDVEPSEAALGLFEELPDDRLDGLGRELIAMMRPDPRRCGRVANIAWKFEQRGLPPVRWQADLRSTCDVLYVLCTGLQPDLDTQIAGPSGLVTLVETCDPRFLDEDEDDSHRFSCKPSRKRVPASKLPISPALVQACHAGTPLVATWEACESLDLTVTHDFEFRSEPDGRKTFVRLEIDSELERY